jgi:hypothetical protein
MAGLPGSVSEVSMLSLGLHSLVETIFMEDMVLLQNETNTQTQKENRKTFERLNFHSFPY